MADIIPAPTISISGAIPTNGEVGPLVSGRLPPAVEAADDVALPLAEAVVVVVAVAEAEM
jgi:hypothetical protein